MNVTYLDNCATTKVAEPVIEAMLPYLRHDFGNASSQHTMGKRARRAVDVAAEQVAALIGASPGEIVFTSGATESNNIVLQGLFRNDDTITHNAILCPIDHKSVLEIGRALRRTGVDVRMMRVDGDGVIDLHHAASHFDEQTAVVSASWVNGEIGTVQPMAPLAELAHEYDAVVHADATQAVSRIPVNVDSAGIDALSLSAHKMHGPKGIGALYLRSGLASRVAPLQYGGGQYALRSGTIPTHLAVGLGKAAEMVASKQAADDAHVRLLRDIAFELLSAELPAFEINGNLDVSVPHIVNIRTPGVLGESIVTGLPSVALSTGSACTSESLEPSHVLTGIGLSAEHANESLRICLDADLSPAELELGLRQICAKARDLAVITTSLDASVP